MADPMVSLLLASALFVAGHFGLSSTPLRGILVKIMGERPYQGLYSLIALGALVWMVMAYGQAPREALWQWGQHVRWLPSLLMPFALFFVIAGSTSPNPTSIGQDGVLFKAIKSENPARGILRVTRHPTLWGILLWALGHIIVRGDSATLLFFGSFFVTAALGTRLLDRKKAAQAGDGWKKLIAVTSNIPMAAILAGRNRFQIREFRWWQFVITLAVYGGVMMFHQSWFGVRPY